MSVERKFVESYDIENWEVLTDTGWSDISQIHKTIEYQEWTLETLGGYSLVCADTHIVFDENYQEVFVKDLTPFTSTIITKSGLDLVIRCKPIPEYSNMYDMTIDSEDHRFWTNGILSHNTTTAAGFLLWSILFQENYSVAILANKGSLAREILERIKYAYEFIPKFLQQGVITWNKGNIGLENGSKIFAYATSATGVRGGSFNCIFLDEFAFVQHSLAEDFFRATYPVISSGKSTKVIIVSCVTKDTFIFTDSGIRRVENFINDTVEANPDRGYEVPSYKVLGMDGINHGKVMVNSGKAQTLKVTSRFSSIECSLNHKLWGCKNGNYKWVHARDLKIGDSILINYGNNIWGTNNGDIETFNNIECNFLEWNRDNLRALLKNIFRNCWYYTSDSEYLLISLRMVLMNFGVLSEMIGNTLEIPNSQRDSFNEYINIGNISDNLLEWDVIREIEESENLVYDFSLNHVEGDDWCHSVLYNGIVGHQTPNGLNMFYKMWVDAVEKRSTYIPYEIHWSEVPGRDEAWMEETIKNTSQEAFEVEFNCEFVGSTSTLITGSKLRSLTFKNPILSEDDFDVYAHPEEGRHYICVVDCSEGVQQDYSTVNVIDVTEAPYIQVAKYRDNKTPLMFLPNTIYSIALKYNEAFVLVETNNIGQQVVDILHYELEYENIYKVDQHHIKGQIISSGYKRNSTIGIRTTKTVKKVGCANLKTLIESDKLIIQDFDTIAELNSFVRIRDSYAAEDGAHDDLVMGLVLFAWLTSQTYFKDSTHTDIRKLLLEEQNINIEDRMTPIGFFNDGRGVNEYFDGEDIWYINLPNT